MDTDHNTVITWIGNLGGAGAVVASLLGWLPVVGALVALIWYAIQIKESQTFRNLVSGRRDKQIAKLKARLAALLLEQKL